MKRAVIAGAFALMVLGAAALFQGADAGPVAEAAGNLQEPSAVTTVVSEPVAAEEGGGGVAC